ncbi:MAG: double-strand break repair helicase AddA [Alphaproteobacteria bacterium PA4]|nr:MAG: double-strand break repair helicase AddA [Alphaproteobacteria bacterium PA4]
MAGPTAAAGAMNGEVKALLPLLREQAEAAAPTVNAWVAASAGTGKTQVLSARVLRLLLGGTPPHAILCLTFTKLAAAEMQTRVFQRLAHWARCPEPALVSDLAALDAETGPLALARARRLFAQVLDAPQGLAVQTIHAFAQGLIASFPIEAGVAPGFATLDDRSAGQLQQRLLVEAIERADREGDSDFLADLAAISIAGGEQRLHQVAARLARHGRALEGLPAAIEPMLRRGFGLASDRDAAAALAAAMAGFDMAGVRRLADAMHASGKPSFTAAAMKARAALVDDPDVRFAALRGFFLTAKDEARSDKAVPADAAKADAGLKPLFSDLAAAMLAIVAEQALHAAVDHAAWHLRIGRRLAADWARAKARLGVIDYDDMIVAARRLLTAPGAADWVRYKLDQRIDHVLVDEAQDTNDRQWDIVRALTEEFFSGQGARDVERTLFVVGDYKQAIFGFQGSDPKVYRDQFVDFHERSEGAGNPLQRIALSTNFRSVGTILDVVDGVITVLGPNTFDSDGVPRHVAHRKDGEGVVTLWPPIAAETAADDDAEPEGDTDDDAEPPRARKAEIRMAHQVAATIAGWLDPRDPLILPAQGRPVRPEDILVLVRSRSGFSGALVSALHVNQVPIAGVDRLKLSDPLAVADLLALARFALQPADDLVLAALLVSPFIGLDHGQLFALAHDRPGTLWAAVQASGEPVVQAARDRLRDVLGFADFAAPYAFFERVLSGPLGGRARLVGRLGPEARDAIDAVLDQALAFEAANAPSLQGFIAWIDSDDLEIKRDPDAPLDAVRLMTVHGAKGLQAPVVILADATKRRQAERDAPVLMSFDNGPELPIFLASRKGLDGPLADVIDAADADAAREHCRLLYVALTRAEDMLFIGGALPGKATEPHEESWYHSVQQALTDLGAEAIEAEGWGPGEAFEYRSGTPAARTDPGPVLRPDDGFTPPGWALTPAPREARPPRPLSPSAIAADDVAAPPPGPAARAAAKRGSALHALFERLPDLPPERRRAVGEGWLAMAWPDLDAAALVTTVLGILDDPRFAAVFAPGALVEAPVAATVDGIVIAGSVDRLLVTPDTITIIDFKTGRRVPASADRVEPYHLKQIAAYAAALAQVFPGRAIRAALLFSEGPALLELPDALLQLHRPQAALALNDGAITPN